MTEDQRYWYERGFIAGMSKQAQSSVDKAVNAMSQRTWVGLTDEELRQIWYDDAPVEGGTYIDKLRQVETKLKEKNT